MDMDGAHPMVILGTEAGTEVGTWVGTWVGLWVGIAGDMDTTPMDIALMAMHIILTETSGTTLTETLGTPTTGIMVTITTEDGLYPILTEIEIQETEALRIGAGPY